MRLAVYRGDAEPKAVNSAKFVVTMTDANGTRTFTSASPNAPWWREYSISTHSSLRIQVTVRGDTPYVVGDAATDIPLKPDLFLHLFVYAWSPSMDPHLYGCQCPHRLAFPLHASAPINDSLIIAWENETRSRPNPIQ
jgi:hypothetical protein